jgi:phosphoglucomutase
VDKAAAEAMMAHMASGEALKGVTKDDMLGFEVATADVFEYTDPVDDSVSSNQGVRFIFTDGSRIVFRLSGTGVVGATVRLYLEKYEAPSGTLDQFAPDVVQTLAQLALKLSDLAARTGRQNPDVIT